MTPVNSQLNQTIHRVDARGQVLGRLATQVATILIGKHRPTYEPWRTDGESVIVEHARQVRVTGRKLQDKLYRRHTGYLGHLRTTSLRDLLGRDPTEVIRQAVYGMLPPNRLRARRMKRLLIHADDAPAAKESR